MTDQPQPTKPLTTAPAAPAAVIPRLVVTDPLTRETAPDESTPAIGVPTPVNELTPEEQMALFEKELKEKDWGHQPC